jgi:Bacterial protein of unknown function (DUF903)
MKLRCSFKAIGRFVLEGTLCLLLAGCALHYDVTLGNGAVVRAKTKPKLDPRGFYVFKDLSGREIRVNRMRVREIQAVRAGSKPSTSYLEPGPSR